MHTRQTTSDCVCSSHFLGFTLLVLFLATCTVSLITMSFTMTMELNSLSPEESNPMAAKLEAMNKCKASYDNASHHASKPSAFRPRMPFWCPFKSNSEHLNISILIVTVISILVVSSLLFFFCKFIFPTQAPAVAIINPLMVSVAIVPASPASMSPNATLNTTFVILSNTTTELTTNLPPVNTTDLRDVRAGDELASASNSTHSNSFTTINIPNNDNNSFLNQSFIRKLIRYAQKVNLDLTEAASYCKPKNNSSLANCELNWEKILDDSRDKIDRVNLTTANSAQLGAKQHDRCFVIREEVTCFFENNSTSTTVHLMQLGLEGALDLEATDGRTYVARHLLALSTEDYILITGETPDQFCSLTLHQHECVSYKEMLAETPKNKN